MGEHIWAYMIWESLGKAFLCQQDHISRLFWIYFFFLIFYYVFIYLAA